MDLPKHLRRWRRWRGWTQTELARKMQIDQSTVSNWESGKTRAWCEVPAIAKAFGFSCPSDFLAMVPPETE